MASGIGVRTVRAILNKVPSVEIERQILKQLEQKEVKPIGTVYLDPKISEANFLGKVLGDSGAKEEVRKITHCLLDLTSEKTNSPKDA
jgi:CO dehydrogenase nickel-insertion accessory protein CooC1